MPSGSNPLSPPRPSTTSTLVVVLVEPEPEPEPESLPPPPPRLQPATNSATPAMPATSRRVMGDHRRSLDGSARRSLGRSLRGSSYRQHQRERGGAGDGAHGQAAVHAVGELAGDRQAEARALCLLAAGEERLEYVRHVLVLDAHAPIGDL